MEYDSLEKALANPAGVIELDLHGLPHDVPDWLDPDKNRLTSLLPKIGNWLIWNILTCRITN